MKSQIQPKRIQQEPKIVSFCLNANAHPTNAITSTAIRPTNTSSLSEAERLKKVRYKSSVMALEVTSN